jgi:hypothetical protein
VDLLIQLLRRRENPIRTRELLIQRVHATPHLPYALADAPKISATICPVLPKGPICSTGDCWEFLNKMQPPYIKFFPTTSLRRVRGGVTSFGHGEYGALTTTVQCLGNGLYVQRCSGGPFLICSWMMSCNSAPALLVCGKVLGVCDVRG